MAKLTVLTLAFATLVSLATAHTTIITTTIADENPISEQRQCRQQLQSQKFNQCRNYIQEGQNYIPFKKYMPGQRQQQQQEQRILQQCCQELQNVDEQCQCEAVKQAFREAQHQEQQELPSIIPLYGPKTQRLKQKAEALPNLCNLEQQQCRIGSISNHVTESNFDITFFDWPFDWPFRTGSQQCRESEIQRPVNQCQRFVEQQMQSGRQYQQQSRPYQQRRGQQQPELQQCCQELQNVQRKCQCRAIEEVGRRVMRQQRRSHLQQGGRFGDQPMEIARRVIQNLPNECEIDVQQCDIPY